MTDKIDLHAQIDQLGATALAIKAERDRLLEEVERMRPVYEKAVAFIRQFRLDGHRIPPTTLDEAVDAALVKEPR